LERIARFQRQGSPCTGRQGVDVVEEQVTKIIESAVPEEIIELLGSEATAQKEAHEAFILDLVRRGRISKGKAAELLGISLWDLPAVIAHYQLPWFSYSQ
jgi:hypothetical protein